MIKKLQGVTFYDIKPARKHAAKDQAGMPAEPDHYCWKKLNDAQINHSLDFLHGGVMQNVAMAPALLNFPVAEKPAFLILPEPYTKLKLWIYIYISACNKYQYVQRTGCPSKRTFWNILNNCPASQRKSLAGLDNLASEGLDAYDTGTNHTEMLVEALTDNQQYLKAVYHIHCSSAECDGVVDHCLKYGLSTLDSTYPDDN